MTHPRHAIAALTAALFLTAASAQAASIVPALTALETQGYEILDVDTYGSQMEIEAIKPDGTRVELIVETATGKILSEQPED